MPSKFYAVKVGRQPGIYRSWDECKSHVDGYAGAKYKSFKTEQEAVDFMEGQSVTKSTAAQKIELPKVYAFTDGSFNAATGVYGFGGFLHYSEDEDDIELRGHGSDVNWASSRNVAGEIGGAIAAMEKALELGLKELTIFYDYAGLENWPLRKWKTNKAISMAYVAAYDMASKSVDIHFQKVAAHTGIAGNEAADRMAKEEVGLL